MQICHVKWLGLIPYQQAWELQHELAGQVACGKIPPTLLLLEHPHTYTFGRRGKSANLLLCEEELKQRGIEVFWVDRGGDVTYHGPGQLVGYPIIPLKADSLVSPVAAATPSIPEVDYVGYLRKLEQVLITALVKFGAKAGRVKGLTGVWVDGAKIAAIGVKVDARGITLHGFALNVTPDMSYWDGIIGCGLEGSPVTSLAKLMKAPPTMQEVIQALVVSFGEVFRYDCQIFS